jgi:hypothetical protein
MAVPYGYRIDPETNALQIFAPEQRVLAKVRELRAAGFSLRAVSKMLAEAGMLARTGRPLAPTQVARMDGVSPEREPLPSSTPEADQIARKDGFHASELNDFLRGPVWVRRDRFGWAYAITMRPTPTHDDLGAWVWSLHDRDSDRLYYRVCSGPMDCGGPGGYPDDPTAAKAVASAIDAFRGHVASKASRVSGL